jgi:outer membrane protein assembly factor BamB
MKKFLFLIGLLVLGACSVNTQQSPAEGVLQHSSLQNPGRNMVCSATHLPESVSYDHIVWEKDIGAKWVLSQPFIADDLLILGTDARGLSDEALKRGNPKGGAYVALDHKTGERVWELSLPGKTYSGSYGTCTPPTREGDRLYGHSNGFIFCFDINGMADGNDGPFKDELEFYSMHVGEDGEPISEMKDNYGDIIWMFNMHEKYGMYIHDASAGSPLIVGDMLWCNTSNPLGRESKWGPTDAPYVVVLDKETGKLVARDAVDTPWIYHGHWSGLTLGEVNDEPAVIWGDGQGTLRSFELVEPKADGTTQTLTQIWEFDANPPEYRTHEGKPILYTRHGQLFPRYMDDVEWAEKKGHKPNSEWGPSEFIATPVFYNGKIYVGIGRDHYYTMGPVASALGGFYCIDPNGKGDITKTNVVWKVPEVGRTQNTVAISDGLLFVPDMVGNLTCVDIETGEVLWQHDLEKYVASRNPFIADGKLYVASSRNEYYVFEVSREKKLLSQERMRGNPTTPAAVDGMLFVATEKTVAAYGKEKTK